MIKPNTEKSNNLKAPFGGLASNTRPIPPNTTLTTSKKSSETTDNNKFQRKETKDNSQAVFHNHLDWLTFNFSGLTGEEFQELLERTGKGLIVLEKDKSWSSGEKAKNYQNTISSPIGLKGAYSSYQKENNSTTLYDVTISLSGQYFTTLSTIEQWELCRYLYSIYLATCSRIDTSIDDYSFNNIPIDEMIEAYRRGDSFDFRKYHSKTDEADPKNPSTVHYFGAEGSKKLIRVYNHQDESLRLETQFRAKYAQVAFETIATLKRGDKSDDEWSKIIQKTIGEIAVGAIDFRDKSKLKNKSKADKSKTKRLNFWQDFIDKIGVAHQIKKPKPNIDMSSHQASFSWLERCASKTLAKAFNILGKERFFNYVYKLIKHGESKFTPQDKKQIEYLRNNVDYLNLD
ncbi:MAG: replication initiation factor domain-containing protein [Cyanobacteria bacterium P01_A01_bin.84]